MKDDHNLVVVTSRQHVIRDETLQWIDKHYPEIFSEVHFGNHFAKSGQSKKKSEICKEIGADVLVDDNPKYAHECASSGMHVLLFNWERQYPWSTQPPECVAHSHLLSVLSSGATGVLTRPCKAAGPVDPKILSLMCVGCKAPTSCDLLHLSM